jgi:hypothetical protein
VRVAVLVEPPPAAEILTLVDLATGAVETLKLAVVLFAVTVTVAGTVATAAFILFSVTTVPPEGAGPLRVTVATEGLPPPVTVVGFRTRERTAGALTVSWSLLVTPLEVAEMLKAFVETATGVVVIGNVAVFVPEGTVTLAGTVAAALALARLTRAPPEGALPIRVTVPEAGLPPVTLGGVTTTWETGGAAAWTVSGAVKVTAE